jgi:uncharacterized membrane protein YeaQ/YmgE (transglycosylase-associated protein family)
MFYLVWVVVVGILAGWLAGQITKGRGFGLLGDLIVGILGSLLGSFIWIDWDIRLWFIGASNNVRYRCHRPALVDSVNQESLADTVLESMPFGLEPAL